MEEETLNNYLRKLKGKLYLLKVQEWKRVDSQQQC